MKFLVSRSCVEDGKNDRDEMPKEAVHTSRQSIHTDLHWLDRENRECIAPAGPDHRVLGRLLCDRDRSGAGWKKRARGVRTAQSQVSVVPVCGAKVQSF